MPNTAVQIESLESRSMFSATAPVGAAASVPHTPALEVHHAKAKISRFIIGFWGYAFGGTPGTGFGNEWTTNLVNAASAAGAGTAKMFAEESGPANAETWLLSQLDTRHDHIITAAEIKNVRLRVVGYSLGGIVAANLTRDLDQAGQTVDGYKLDAAVPVQELVTLDPVNYPINFPPLVNTAGPESNVAAFYNYYETGSTNGVSELNLFDSSTGASLGGYSQDDTPLPIIGYLSGDPLDSSAKKTTQIQVNAGKYAGHPVEHLLQDGVNGELKGKQTDHGTLPFYAYPYALAALTA